MTNDDRVKPLELDDELRHVFAECRMVLPGIQALFGFQMIAVFSDAFAEKLMPSQQTIHGLAIGFVVLATSLIMSPAALHRRAEPQLASDRFLRAASRLMRAAMIFLAAGISFDVYIVATLIRHSQLLALSAGAGAFALFLSLWEGYPALYRRRNAAR